jgi:hypothetical protein
MAYTESGWLLRVSLLLPPIFTKLKLKPKSIFKTAEEHKCIHDIKYKLDLITAHKLQFKHFRVSVIVLDYRNTNKIIQPMPSYYLQARPVF